VQAERTSLPPPDPHLRELQPLRDCAAQQASKAANAPRQRILILNQFADRIIKTSLKNLLAFSRV
jgi:hypothetical protein